MKSSRPGEPAPGGRRSGGVRRFDHTADVGLDIRGSTLEDLFAWAAAGFARLAFRPAYLARSAPGRGAAGTTRSGPPPSTRHVTLGPAPDVEALLIAWLNHLIYLLETEGRAVRSCRLEVAQEGPTAEAARAWTLRGTLLTTPAGPGDVAVAVKAATYHGLEVTRAERGGESHYTARVILDI